MKKIFTFLFASAMFSTVFAQYNARDQKDNAYNKGYDNGNGNGYGMDKGYGKDNGYNKDGGLVKVYDRDDDRMKGLNSKLIRERDMQIDQINRDYDFKIQSVKNRFFMSREKKQRVIWMLEQQRRDEISKVYNKYSFLLYSKNDHDNWRH